MYRMGAARDILSAEKQLCLETFKVMRCLHQHLLSDNDVLWSSAIPACMQCQRHRDMGRMFCREAALRRREERKRKREREEKAAAKKAEADSAAGEMAAAEKEGGEHAVKEETGISEVKEEGSNVDAPVAAGGPPSKVPNGDNVSASMLCDSLQLVTT